MRFRSPDNHRDKTVGLQPISLTSLFVDPDTAKKFQNFSSIAHSGQTNTKPILDDKGGIKAVELQRRGKDGWVKMRTISGDKYPSAKSNVPIEITPKGEAHLGSAIDTKSIQMKEKLRALLKKIGGGGSFFDNNEMKSMQLGPHLVGIDSHKRYNQGGMMNITAQTAQDLASKGRYGDSMLVHMNPEEVAGIASLAPGQMTINPETGLPEAFKFGDFLRFALPIAGSIVVPQLALSAAGGAAAAGAGGSTFANFLAGTAGRSLMSGLGSFLGSKLSGADTGEALTTGLTAGLTYGLGSKMFGAKPVGAEAAEGLKAQQLKQLEQAASAGEVAKITAPGADFGAGIPPTGEPISSLNRQLLDSTAYTSPSTGTDAIVARSPTFLPQKPLLDAKGIPTYDPKGTAFVTDASGEVFPVKSAGVDYGGILGRGSAGAIGAFAGASMPEEMEEEQYEDIGLASPWRRKYRPKPPGYIGEFQYFDPSGIYGASGGYVNKMQEGGEVDPTSPVEDDSLGLMAYAPLIANYPSYDTGLGALPEYNPTPMQPTMQPTMRTDMGEKDYGVAPVAAGSGGIGSREPRFGFDSFDDRKAPEGFMYFLANKPGRDGYNEMMPARPEYRLTPTKNLSALEMEDLTSRGILMPYRPEGARYIDYRPQVEQTEGTRGGEYGPPIGMQEGGLAAISEGMVSGAGDGMSDNVYGTIDNMQKVALSEGEFIVPADVVSGIGNGSSESGAERLYDMMDRIRKARTGTMQQAPAIDVSVMMPA